LAHLDRVVGGDLLDRLAANDRLNGDSGFVIRAIGAELAIGGSPFQGR